MSEFLVELADDRQIALEAEFYDRADGFFRFFIDEDPVLVVSSKYVVMIRIDEKKQ